MNNRPADFGFADMAFGNWTIRFPFPKTNPDDPDMNKYSVSNFLHQVKILSINFIRIFNYLTMSEPALIIHLPHKINKDSIFPRHHLQHKIDFH
jgi:hypothetical protein